MSNVVRYRGYWAKVEFSAEDSILHGTIDGISDLVTFECEDVSHVQKEFESAVDDYLSFCQEVGKAPEKPCSGSFNVRITPELHRECCRKADELDISLNKLVYIALDEKLHSPKTISIMIKPDSFVNQGSYIPDLQKPFQEAKYGTSFGSLSQMYQSALSFSNVN